MQKLRDKLRQAGVVSKQAARQAKTEERRDRKDQGGLKAELEAEAQRQRDYEEKVAAQAALQRAQQEAANAARAEQERANRLRQLVDAHTVRRIAGDERAFHFLLRDGHIRRLHTTFDVADRLILGELAIVEAPHHEKRGYAVVEAAGVRRLEELGPEMILFWNKPGAGTETLPAYGSGADR
ncbi:MAG: DUF2058 family protein [Deltaproteobacteria bacterium]|nr:DUF2058 family protein [Deltaproteobacteria bacterium]